ncbi:hypothetical protein G647_01473 [Cladophialophora carrionii CBS 160.54]|uniref:Uncharacterized protein n=1 Tax=Cladophialophora carrionii CBS 160.54 TaxID=1279043 RepID=V9DQ65_9EURO|nr:uncharacterized protein G647_01473 [Cladophialophora carrionii CBS 160.54]ETI29020.1 hypothetical protein G647_01473 [Cladophialophora carrionii CBS 160.54]
MEVFDIYSSIDHAQGPSPLTQVDFFHTKHRAIKKAHAEVAAKGHNLGHSDDIGQITNDPAPGTSEGELTPYQYPASQNMTAAYRRSRGNKETSQRSFHLAA